MGARSDFPVPFGWYAVSLSRELAPGDVKPLSYFGRELVLFRTESGEPKVLDAFCPHLGAHLGYGGRVKGERIACPFHGWEFNGGGVCGHVPYARKMPPRADGKQTVFSYPVVERNQIVWAWYHPARIEPTFDVEKVAEIGDPEWTDYLVYEWTIGVALQEAAENSADAAHFVYVHNVPSLPQSEVSHDGHRRFARYVSRVPDIDENGMRDTTGTRWREAVLETSSNGPGQALQRFTGLFDTIQVGLTTPIDAEHFHLRTCYIQRRDLDETQRTMAKAVADEISRQLEQDIPIWEHKVFQPKPILCDGDGPIAQFRRWFGQFYARAPESEVHRTPVIAC